MDKIDAMRHGCRCSYCGCAIGKGHWNYMGRVFCSDACLLEWVDASDNNYEQIIRMVAERHNNRSNVSPLSTKAVLTTDGFSEANRFRGLDYD